jgi:DNA-binding CsgD family transcriptional regulator
MAIATESLDTLNAIADCVNEAELVRVVRAFLQSLSLGTLRFIFVAVKVVEGDDGSTPMEFRYLAGCSPALIQMYSQRRWYMNDPIISYALNHSAPLSGIGDDEFPALSSGQRQFLDAMRSGGFRSFVAAPARTVDASRTGVLVVGSTVESHQALLGYRALFRAMSAELLEWRSREDARATQEQYRLTDGEIDILGMLSAGGSAEDIAARYGRSVRDVYRTFYSAINEKMGTKNIAESKRIALEAGLLKG